jgi:hypothetical protein
MKKFIDTIVVELISIRLVDYGKSFDIKRSDCTLWLTNRMRQRFD